MEDTSFPWNNNCVTERKQRRLILSDNFFIHITGFVFVNSKSLSGKKKLIFSFVYLFIARVGTIRIKVWGDSEKMRQVFQSREKFKITNSNYFETLFIFYLFVIFITLFVHLLTCSTTKESSNDVGLGF